MLVNILEARVDSRFYRVLLKLLVVPIAIGSQGYRSQPGCTNGLHLGFWGTAKPCLRADSGFYKVWLKLLVILPATGSQRYTLYSWPSCTWGFCVWVSGYGKAVFILVNWHICDQMDWLASYNTGAPSSLTADKKRDMPRRIDAPVAWLISAGAVEHSAKLVLFLWPFRASPNSCYTMTSCWALKFCLSRQ